MTTYIGIDTGKKGAVVWLNDDGKILRANRTPLVGSEYDENAMIACLAPQGAAIAAIEFMSGFVPHDGKASIRSQGISIGLWRGMARALRVPYVLVAPKTWRKVALEGWPKAKEGGNTKSAVLASAKARWPEIPIKHKIEWDIADAAWIAEWLRTQYGRK